MMTKMEYQSSKSKYKPKNKKKNKNHKLYWGDVKLLCTNTCRTKLNKEINVNKVNRCLLSKNITIKYYYTYINEMIIIEIL